MEKFDCQEPADWNGVTIITTTDFTNTANTETGMGLFTGILNKALEARISASHRPVHQGWDLIKMTGFQKQQQLYFRYVLGGLSPSL